MALAAISLIAVGCGSNDDGNGEGNGGATAITLGMPANNSECITGISVSNLQSTVTFEWTAIENTETYFVYVTNLNTRTQLQYNAGTGTTKSIDLQKGTPYSWYISSKKVSGETVLSDTWKFYNAGEAVTSHPPFPADLVSPVMSSTLESTSVTLQWSTTDIDNDIANHKVYMDSTTNPSTLIGTVTTQSLANPVINGGGTYYWKVVTTDNAGNATTSPVFQFKVQ